MESKIVTALIFAALVAVNFVFASEVITKTVTLSETLTFDPCARGNFSNFTNFTMNATNATNGTYPCPEPELPTEAPAIPLTPAPAPPRTPVPLPPSPPPTPAPVPATPTPLTPTPNTPAPPKCEGGECPVCETNSSYDPYTDCQCPYGKTPSDNGCCKKQCDAKCDVEHPLLLRTTYQPPQMDSCNAPRICNYMWGDPHAKYGDFRFDPQWHGWMLMSQCDGLKIFSFAEGRSPKHRVTVQSKIMIRYRSSMILIDSMYRKRPATFKVQGLNSLESGANLEDVALPKLKGSATVGDHGAQLTLSRISSTKLQICTPAGDTIKIIGARGSALQLQICLAPTCNLRGTGFMGVHGALLENRFPLPWGHTNDTVGKVPKNRSPYFKEYMTQWYAETNRQLRNIYPSTHPQFPKSNSGVCLGYEEYATPVPTPAPTERYRYFYSPTKFSTLRDADAFCAQQGGYLATMTSYADARQFSADMTKRRVSASAYKGALLGGTDKDKEGTWYWKYGPPHTRGKTISTGRGNSHVCKQTNCFWLPGEPNNFHGGEDFLVVMGWNDWNDIKGPYQTRKVICEFILPDSSTQHGFDTQATVKVNSDSTAEKLIAKALEQAGVDKEMASSAAEQRNVSEGTSCDTIIAQCKAMNCPNAIFTENQLPADQCEFAQEWILAVDINKGLPADSPLRVNENIISFKKLEAYENTNECDDDGKHLCDSCDADGGVGCYACPTNLTCASDELLTPDPVAATCTCQKIVPPGPECTTNQDCEWSPLSVGLMGSEYMYCSEQQRCVIEGGPVYVQNGTAFILLNVTVSEDAGGAEGFNTTLVQSSVLAKITSSAFSAKDSALAVATLNNVVVQNIRRFYTVNTVRFTIAFSFTKASLLQDVAKWLNADFTPQVLPSGYSVQTRVFYNNTLGDFQQGGTAASDDGDGSSAGAVAAVVIVVILLLVGIVGAAVFFTSRKRNSSGMSEKSLSDPLADNKTFDASRYARHQSLAEGQDSDHALLNNDQERTQDQELQQSPRPRANTAHDIDDLNSTNNEDRPTSQFLFREELAASDAGKPAVRASESKNRGFSTLSIATQDL